MEKARIKTEKEIQAICLDTDVNGYHLKGQFFPNECFQYSNTIIEIVDRFSNNIVCACIIDSEYHFFSVDALDFKVNETEVKEKEEFNLFNYDKT
ncbi:hypothetical protein ACVVIH_20610 [Chryseobacterium arthrosphaerae]|uniref:hypothetical protein n=1 Tax=Chryseobacterium arthrosphaerae TaxID=651561 RepID=UPI003D33D9A8